MASLISPGTTRGALTIIGFVERRRYPGGSAVAIYLCKCRCGRERTVTVSKFNKAHETCYCEAILKRVNSGTVFYRLFSRYSKDAQRRGLEFSLSRSFFDQLVVRDCAWCGQSPVPRVISAGGKSGLKCLLKANGVDRVDNKRGYIDGNVVPCCTVCNNAKAGMTATEFLAWIKRVSSFQLKRQ